MTGRGVHQCLWAAGSGQWLNGDPAPEVIIAWLKVNYTESGGQIAVGAAQAKPQVPVAVSLLPAPPSHPILDFHGTPESSP